MSYKYNINLAIGKNLASWMREKDCNTTNLSNRTGLSTSKISRIRSGRGCKMQELEAIAKALNIDVADIFAVSQIDQHNTDWKNLLAVINGMAQRRDSGTFSIGANIRRAREARKMSQKQLAKKIGLSQTTISEIETGDRDATTGIMWAISQELDVPVEVLLPPPRHHVTGDVWAARKFALELLKQDLPS